MSGQPGRLATLTLNLSPRARSERRSRSSHRVPTFLLAPRAALRARFEAGLSPL